jgi:group II intron reverse transcriptase/maturase
MVKVILLESYPLVTSREGLVHAWCRYYAVNISKLEQLLLDYTGRQVKRIDLKMENWKPKGTTITGKELGDCLSVGAAMTYGNGASILGNNTLKGGRKYYHRSNLQYIGVRCYSNVHTMENERELPRRFEKLIDLCAKEELKVNDIYKLMFNLRMYEVAYNHLKSNPGNMTPGINPVTLDGFSIEWINSTINQMKDESFQFKPGRRIQIPKVGSSSTRPLTIAPPRDKLVQEVMRMIIEAIFEPIFSTNSHGFRQGRSCHTALRQVKTQFGASSFIIEGDIPKCFDSFDHHILMALLAKRISDERFLNLIWKALRAGYMESHVVQNSLIGTPQGSIISPILANIYLHPLDLFVDKLKRDYDKGTVARRNPEYRKLESQRIKANRNGSFKLGAYWLKKMQLIKARLPNDPEFRRLYYVRYADDWVIAIRGSHSDAQMILQQIREMLLNELKLNLSVEKSKITNPRIEPALFLGSQITISRHVYSTLGKHHQRWRVASQLRLLAPMERIYKKLITAGFMSAQFRSGTPKFLWYANDKDTIIKLYNSVLLGYLNYYSFTHNYPKVASSLEFILKTSCAKLLAAKFKLRSVSKVIEKYGKDLQGKDKIAFLKPSYKMNLWDFKSNPKNRIQTLFASYLSAATLGALNCSKCGSLDRVEMHHVRLLSDLNPKLSEIDRIMAKRRRKQIPLCRSCHLEHHKLFKPWKTKKT